MLDELLDSPSASASEPVSSTSQAWRLCATCTYLYKRDRTRSTLMLMGTSGPGNQHC